MKPVLPDGYTNIYLLRLRLRIISMSSHVNRLFAGQEMASLHLVGSVVSWTAQWILVAIVMGVVIFEGQANILSPCALVCGEYV